MARLSILGRTIDLTRARDDITESSELDAFIRSVDPTWAGLQVNEKTAMQISAFFAGVRSIAEDIGKLDFDTFSRTGAAGSREEAREIVSPLDDAVAMALAVEPNPWQSAQDFRQMLTAHALMRGNGFAKIVRVRGEFRELIPMHPAHVTISVNKRTMLPEYIWTPVVDGTTVGSERLKHTDVFHLRGLSTDGWRGLSVLEAARQSLAAARGADRYAARFWGGGARPDGVLQHPGRLNRQVQKRLKEQIEEDTGGENARGTLVLEEGMTWQQVGISNDDAQFLQSRQFTVIEVARWLRMPPHKLFALERSTFNNIEHQSIEYVGDTLHAWAVRWQLEARRKLFGVRSDRFAEIRLDSLLRGDTATRFDAYNKAIMGGWMTRNEARRRENLNPEDGLDEFLVPANVQPDDEGDGDGTGIEPSEGGAPPVRDPRET